MAGRGPERALVRNDVTSARGAGLTSTGRQARAAAGEADAARGLRAPGVTLPGGFALRAARVRAPPRGAASGGQSARRSLLVQRWPLRPPSGLPGPESLD